MSIFVSTLISALFLLVTASATARAVAGPSRLEPQRASLSYEVPAGCPEESNFVEAVNTRVHRSVDWRSKEGGLQIAVTITNDGQRVSGKLEISEGEGIPTRREFTAATCEEVSSALALVTALALDPNARTEPLPARVTAPSSSSEWTAEALPPAGQSSEGTAGATQRVPPRGQATARPEQKSAEAQLPRQLSSTAGPADERRNNLLFWGPNAGVVVGSAPEPLALFGVTLGARREGFGWAPSLQLSALWGKTGTTGPSAAEGTFAWAVGRVEGCPWRLGLTRQLALEPCLILEVGRLSARGASAEISEPVTAERWWLAAGGTLGVHWSAGNFFIRFGVLGLVPATRDEFVFRDPDRSVHRPSAFLYGGAAGFGFQFGS